VGDTAGEVLRGAIVASLARIEAQEAVIRAGTDPEGVHQARVGMRRLRSDLRTFRPVLKEAWSEPLRAELAWFAGELGAVRDRDVLLDRLRATAASLEEVTSAGGLLDRLAGEQVRAHRRAVQVVGGRRHRALLAALAEPPRTTDDAEQPASVLLPALAGVAFHELRKAVRRVPEHPTDDDLHRLRIRAKRARYATDVARPVVGKPAKRTAKAIGRLQEVLGEHHDCVVGQAWLRAAVPSSTRGQAFVAGLLVAELGRQAEAHRSAWPAAWERVVADGTPSWLRP
jgi:CHAD domain-containing protein